MTVARPRLEYGGLEFFRQPDQHREVGVLSALFEEGDACTTLPPADVLLCKDVLIHLSNADVQRFLETHLGSRPRYRYIVLVNDKPRSGRRGREDRDIEVGHFCPIDINSPPFNAGFLTVGEYEANATKLVQVWGPR